MTHQYDQYAAPLAVQPITHETLVVSFCQFYPILGKGWQGREGCEKPICGHPGMIRGFSVESHNFGLPDSLSSTPRLAPNRHPMVGYVGTRVGSGAKFLLFTLLLASARFPKSFVN